MLKRSPHNDKVDDEEELNEYGLPKRIRGAIKLTEEQIRQDEACRARQSELLREPAWPDRQKMALESRAVSRFGTSITFVESFQDLKKDVVFPIILKHFSGHTPPNPTLKDIGRSLGGGYTQEVVRLTLAKVLSRGSGGRTRGIQGGSRVGVEVELESEVFMSFRNGTTAPSDVFRLFRDGSIKYFQNDTWLEWTSFNPRWEFAGFPALVPVFVGFDL